MSSEELKQRLYTARKKQRSAAADNASDQGFYSDASVSEASSDETTDVEESKHGGSEEKHQQPPPDYRIDIPAVATHAARLSKAAGYGSTSYQDDQGEDIVSDMHYSQLPSSSPVHGRRSHTGATAGKARPSGNNTLIRLDGNAQYVQHWLLNHGFESNTQTRLSGYTVADLSELSRRDCKDLCGTQDGIRLYNRVRAAVQAAEGGQQSHTYREHTSESPARTRPSIYGCCTAPYCKQSAILLCAGDHCERPLCLVHINKNILTGHSYCEICFETHAVSTTVKNQLHSWVSRVYPTER